MLFAFRSLLQIQDLPRHDLLSQDLGDSLYGAPDTSPQATSLDWSDLSLLLIFLQYTGKLDNKQSLVFCNLIITGNCRPVRKLVCYIYPSRESFLFIRFYDSFYNNLIDFEGLSCIRRISRSRIIVLADGGNKIKFLKIQFIYIAFSTGSVVSSIFIVYQF